MIFKIHCVDFIYLDNNLMQSAALIQNDKAFFGFCYEDSIIGFVFLSPFVFLMEITILSQYI